MARRSVEQIVADAEMLADAFEFGDKGSAQTHDAEDLLLVAEAFQRVAAAERDLTLSVIQAREAGYSWALIGGMMGVTREAARQRYGRYVDDGEEASMRRHPSAEPGTATELGPEEIVDNPAGPIIVRRKRPRKQQRAG